MYNFLGIYAIIAFLHGIAVANTNEENDWLFGESNTKHMSYWWAVLWPLYWLISLVYFIREVRNILIGGK